MSTETTDYKFANAAAAAMALRAEEPAFAWANDYQQSDKVVDAAKDISEKLELEGQKADLLQDLDQQISVTTDPDAKQVLIELKRELQTAKSPDAIRLALTHALNALNGNVGGQDGKEATETLEQRINRLEGELKYWRNQEADARKEAAEATANADATYRKQLTPEEQQAYDKLSDEDKRAQRLDWANQHKDDQDPKTKEAAQYILDQEKRADEKAKEAEKAKDKGDEIAQELAKDKDSYNRKNDYQREMNGETTKTIEEIKTVQQNSQAASFVEQKLEDFNEDFPPLTAKTKTNNASNDKDLAANSKQSDVVVVPNVGQKQNAASHEV